MGKTDGYADGTGTGSLVGTSTNLLVDGIAQELGLAPFGLFEIAPLGVSLALVCGGFLAFAAPRLLPDRQALANVLMTAKREKRLIGQPKILITSVTCHLRQCCLSMTVPLK